MATHNTIKQLRRRLQDVKDDTGQLLQNDFYLSLWLNLMKSDLGKTEAAVREGLAWWKANAFSLMQQNFSPALVNKLPIFLDGISKEGYPVAYVRLVAVDMTTLWTQFRAELVAYSLKKMVSALPMALELNRLRYEQLGDEALKSTRGYAIIVDAYGFSLRHLPPTPMKAVSLAFECAREAIKCPSTPRTAHIIGVNTWILMLFKPLVPVASAFGVTLKVYGTDEGTWEKDLCQLIDRKTLEEFRARASNFKNLHVN